MMKLDTPHDCVDVRVADASDDALTTAGNLRKPNMQACVVRLCALERVHGWIPHHGGNSRCSTALASTGGLRFVVILFNAVGTGREEVHSVSCACVMHAAPPPP
jgi:hypothetical protein